ncbi:MAG: hypothetical protein ABJB02_06290 [Dokdonella sp.]
MFRSIVIASLIAASVVALDACGDHNTTADVDADATKAAAPVPARQKTVFDDQLKALDKAKAVEKQLQEDKEKRDKAMQDQGA